MNAFRLAVGQLTSTDQVQVNLAQIQELYYQAVKDRADLVVFPENTLFFRISPGTSLQALKWNGPELEQVQGWVKQAGVPLMLTTAMRAGDGTIRNSTVLLTPNTEPVEVYAKIHMFDVDVEGAPPVRESVIFTRGEGPAVIEVNGWKFGLSICYDLRFSELYLNYAQKVDVILVPSAFLQPTGLAHWHVLLRARAIESQCFVAAPAQSGAHQSGSEVRHTFGHSLVVDPWGKILLELEKSPALAVTELDPALLAKVRRQIPMASHRRL